MNQRCNIDTSDQKKAPPVISTEDFINPSNESPVMDDPIEQNKDYENFLKSILNQEKDYPLPVAVINLIQNGTTIPLITLKSFSLWQGKQKSKKTTLLALMIAAFITKDKIQSNIYFERAAEGVVIIFDNEQGESYAARTMRLILKLAGLETSEKLIYCDLRGYSPRERIKIIKAGIQFTPDVKMVVIDGIVDLLTDFMDASEGHICITDIITLCSSYDIHIAGILHQNKNDKNARAHVGTISSQKCEIEISTEVDPNDKSQSLVSCVNSRGLPFEPFAIKWEKGSLPCIVQGWTEATSKELKDIKYKSTLEQIASDVFKPFVALRQVEAIENIMVAAGKSESTAKRYLNELKIHKIVVKGNDGLYRFNSEGSRVHEGSNEGS